MAEYHQSNLDSGFELREHDQRDVEVEMLSDPLPGPLPPNEMTLETTRMYASNHS